MFVLYTKLIGFVNRENEKNLKNFWAVWSGGVKRKKSFVLVPMLYLAVFIYGSKLPIVLFVEQHFSGSLFEWVHLSI